MILLVQLLAHVPLLVQLQVIGPIAGAITGRYYRYDCWLVPAYYWYGNWYDYMCDCWSRHPRITG